MSDRGNYDYKHGGYRRIRAQVLWRVEQLGWSSTLFKTVDDDIAGEQHQPWAKRRADKTERYGKKYSWIAFFEMAGLQSDLQGMDQKGEREVRLWDVDIDPSFPEQPPKIRIIEVDILGDPEMEMEDWIANGPLPDVFPSLRLSEVTSEEGPWVMLDGFVVQEDEERGRYSFCCIRSFITDSQNADSFASYLTHEAPGAWRLPEKPSVFYTFAGEIPWCSTFPHNGTVDFQYSRVVIPVCDFVWESYHSVTNDAGNATTVAKEAALALELVSRPQTFDLFTQDGLKATQFVSDQNEGFNNQQSACFIHEELLRTYLKKENLSLVWTIWGERRYSAKQIEKLFRGANRSGKRYKYFGWVERYE